MVRSRLGLKALGLSALVVGLMAFATGSAQAETGANWMVNGTNVNSTLLPEVQVKSITGAILLTEVSKKKVDLACTGAKLINAKLGASGAVTLGKVQFEGCTTKIGGVLQGVCKPHSKGAAEGTITTENGKGLLVLHSGKGVTSIVPDEGELFVTIILGKEGVENECSIGEKLPVSGKLSLDDSALTTEAVEHTIVEHAALTDLWVLNKTAEHKSLIDGSAVVKLVGGTHEGLKWSGLPG